MDSAQLDPQDFDRVIEFALENGGIVIVVVSVLMALLSRSRKKEKKQREEGLGKIRSEAEPIEPGDDTGKLSARMRSRQ